MAGELPSARRTRLLQVMAAEKLDAIVCRLPENVLLLTGYWPICGWAFAVLSSQGEAVCIVPDTEEREARDELSDCALASYAFGTKEPVDQLQEIRAALESTSAGRRWRRVGWEESFETAAPAWNAAESLLPAGPTRRVLEGVFARENLVDVTRVLEIEKAAKTPAEAEKVARSARISCIGMTEFCKTVDAGRSGVELAAAVESAIMREGTGFDDARRVRAFAQVATGPEETFRAWRPAEITTTRRLREGDIALLELAVVADGYWRDRTRARVAGRASERQKEINQIVSRGQKAAISVVRPGVSGREVDEAGRSEIRAAGQDRAFVHITGHGLGFRYHEAMPFLASWSTDVLREGMIHSVEPGIYLSDFGGIRIEDDVLVTPQGAQVLGPFPTDLD